MRQPIVRFGLSLGLPLAVLLLQVGLFAQDRLRSMPGYAHYSKMVTQLSGAVQSGSVTVTWSADGKTFDYVKTGKRYRYDIGSRQSSEAGDAPEPAGRGGRGGRGGAGAPERGRQYSFADSPDRTLRAQYNESTRNLHLIDLATKVDTPITTDGSRDKRIKNGTASWVYGEELGQTTAMWWSPDGRKLAFYRFDESGVPDYFLQLDQTKIQSAMDTEAYPKAGAPNPVVDLLVYDVATRKAVKVDLRSGKPFDNSVIGHYAYRVAWSPDGKELLFNRTNRRQNILELVAANPDTGAIRVIIREDWSTGWIENTPLMAFLKDGRRFIWESERNGWKNLYLYDLNGTLLHPLTTHTSFEIASLIKVDEQAGVVFYTARDGDNHLKQQLHRVGLDGKGDVRLTDPKYHHTIGSCMTTTTGRGGGAAGANCGISPDGAHFVDVYQAHNIPPASRLVDARSGKVIADVAASDTTRYQELGLRKAELFTFKSADGQTLLHGLIQFPSNFDPTRKYPVLVPVYGGPEAGGSTARETFVTPNAQAEYGFLIVNLDSRAAPGRGKRTLDEIYLKLGQAEIDDMAAGVRSLASRPVRRPHPGWHLRYVVRRLRVSDVDPPSSGPLRGRFGIISRHLVAALRLDLHRALHVDSPGEQGGVRRGQRDDLREPAQGPADALLRHRRQQRPSVEHDAAHRRAAVGGEELRRPGWSRPRAQRDQFGADDGVLHRTSRDEARDGVDLLVLTAHVRRFASGCGVSDPRLVRIFEQLRASRFADLAGARVSASIPVSERLLNELVVSAIPPSVPVRDVTIQPRRGDRFSVRARLARVDFLPPITITVAIERQPELPDSPLVLRLTSFPGLITMIGAAFPIASKLPPGIRMDKDRVLVDLKTLAESQGYADLLTLVEKVRLTTDEGKLIVALEART